VVLDLVLIPLAVVIGTAAAGGVGRFVRVLTNPETLSAIVLTTLVALAVTLVNVITGTIIAWVLARDNFWGRAVVDVIIDVPFALPTIVAGLVLLTLYGPNSPLGLHLANTRWSVAPGSGLRDPALRGEVRPAGAGGDGRRRGGGRDLPRRRAVDGVLARGAARPGAGHRLGRRAVLRPWDQ
jgi:hypothetical protein